MSEINLETIRLEGDRIAPILLYIRKIERKIDLDKLEQFYFLSNEWSLNRSRFH